MSRLELFLWVVAALAADGMALAWSGISWQPVVLISMVIFLLFLLRQAAFAGLFQDYRQKLSKRYGPVQANLFGLSWLDHSVDKQGKHCDMYVFAKHVVFVTPDPLSKEKVSILAVELQDIGLVKLDEGGHIYITLENSKGNNRLLLKSTLPAKDVIGPLEKLQSELVRERKLQALQKISEKAKQLDEELRSKLMERRRIRVENLKHEGNELVKRFAGIVPEDIFIKDTLFDKIKELLMLELLGRKSPLQGRLEEFLDNDFKPFAQILRDKIGFDFEDVEDFFILLNAVRAEVRNNVRDEFMSQYSSAFEPIAGQEEDKLIEVFTRICGPGALEPKNLEGFRLFLEGLNNANNFKGLKGKVELTGAKMEEEIKKHDLEKKINRGHVFFDDVTDLDVLGLLDFVEFVKNTLIRAGDTVEDIVLYDDRPVEILVNGRQKTLIHAFRPAGSVSQEDIKRLDSAMKVKGVSSGIFITTSYFTNDAAELAGAKGIVALDRSWLQEKICMKG